MIYMAIVNIGWLVFALVWAMAAVTAKRSARGPGWGGQVGVRVTAAVFIYLLIRAIRAGWGASVLSTVVSALSNPVLNVAGLVLFVAGIGLAVWARLYLGRNWGMPMSLRQGHELVTSGPYRFVRHPIYSGILLAVVGSILVGEFWWLAVLPVVIVYFVYSALTEERMMGEQFPGAYPEYMKRTKMLIPFAL